MSHIYEYGFLTIDDVENFFMLHCVFEAQIGSQVKSKGNPWDADDHYPSHYQITTVIAYSYNIQPPILDIL